MVIDFEEIYRMYFRDVFLYAKSISRDSQIAEEITQETFFKALQGIDKFKGKCDIRVWLCQIAKNVYYSMVRKQKRVSNIDLSETEIVDEDNICDKLIDSQHALNIHTILHAMDEPYKEVFSLRMFGELSYLQIATLFGKTENWARVTYHRARLKIIEKIKEADE